VPLKLRARGLILWATAAVGIAGAADESDTLISVADWSLIRDTVQHAPDVQCETQSEPPHLICDSAARRTIWLFTEPGHAAHPAYIQRILVLENGVLTLAGTWAYAGDHAHFDQWRDQIMAEDLRFMRREGTETR
jgi:hypothetical protein